LSENYIVSGVTNGAALSYGVRFFGDRLSVDFALINDPSDPIVPGVPYVAFAVKF
jgi:archaellum component FlaG (FlaF/FlaG flagellin family)